MNDKIFKEENERLKRVIELINKKLELSQTSFKEQENHIIGFKEGQRGTQFTRQALMSLYATESYKLATLLDNPYFGKIDFKKDLDNTIQNIYIGKRALTNLEGDIVIYDWRSPISSMYYDFSIGTANYYEDLKKITGEILTKRQLVIEDGKLIKVEEQDQLTDDKILMYYLNESADSRLKSIVSTIQRQQNQIIRNPLKNNYIIGGVAGSGKTTVALHRIAYLVYNETKNIKESNFMIIGPNEYFLNYISSLLPDLDITSITQDTYETLALNNITSKIKLESSNITLEKVLSGAINPKIINYKSSINYLKLIEEFLEFYVSSHLKNSIIIDNVEICNLSELSLDLNEQKKYSLSYNTLIKEKIKWLSKRIQNKSEILTHKIWEHYKDEYLDLSKNDPKRKEIMDYVSKLQNEIKKGCKKQLNEYFKFMKVNPLNLYIVFINSLTEDMLNCSSKELDELKEYTLSNLKKKKITHDDLAPLLLIEYLVNGNKNYQDYEHVVIDEAQDLSEAEYYVLKKIFSNAVFDIYGDINQSIYAYQGIESWEKLNEIIFENNAKILELNKGYRTTYQICNSANYVLEQIGSKKSECIARKGNDISIKKIDDDKELLIIDKIKEYVNANYKTIAIICKDKDETEILYKRLKKLGLDINIIKESDQNYNGGLCIMPSYLSKGLEFDAVILADADENIYNTSSIIDMRLLYVAMTRALHELQINYSNNLTKALEELIPKHKVLNKK